MWNKLYTAADSRLYNKHGKSSTESKKCRIAGETRILALKMLVEKKEKLAAAAAAEGMFLLLSCGGSLIDANSRSKVSLETP